MKKQFWHDAITERSFVFLQELRKTYKFVLIGGWAVYFFTHALKSKDIDIIVEFGELAKLRNFFSLIKNDRLNEYEVKAEGFDVDIYVPYWSKLGLPLEFVLDRAVSVEGFLVPEIEILIALKLFVYRERKGSLKGQKDLLDIASLLYHGDVALEALQKILQIHNLKFLLDELRSILGNTYELTEIGLNRKKFSDFKKPILKKL